MNAKLPPYEAYQRDLVALLREAAKILERVTPATAPPNMRWPIVDELEGMAGIVERLRESLPEHVREVLGALDAVSESLNREGRPDEAADVEAGTATLEALLAFGPRPEDNIQIQAGYYRLLRASLPDAAGLAPQISHPSMPVVADRQRPDEVSYTRFGLDMAMEWMLVARLGPDTDDFRDYAEGYADRVVRDVLRRPKECIIEAVIYGARWCAHDPQAGNWISAEDYYRNVKKLDVALNGLGGATRPKLIDVLGQTERYSIKLGRPVFRVVQDYLDQLAAPKEAS